MRLSLGVEDFEALRTEFRCAFGDEIKDEDGPRLTSFLDDKVVFKRHFKTNFFALERQEDGSGLPSLLAPANGK